MSERDSERRQRPFFDKLVTRQALAKGERVARRRQEARRRLRPRRWRRRRRSREKGGHGGCRVLRRSITA